MNKEYMLKAIKERISQLQVEYRKYFDIENGPSKSVSGSACLRSRVKKDLTTLKLIEYLLNYCPASMLIDSDEICGAFDRLVEPRKLR